MFTDWIDFDGELSEAQIIASLPKNLENYMIRPDIFDRYADGHTIRRVYIKLEETSRG